MTLLKDKPVILPTGRNFRQVTGGSGIDYYSFIAAGGIAIIGSSSSLLKGNYRIKTFEQNHGRVQIVHGEVNQIVDNNAFRMPSKRQSLQENFNDLTVKWESETFFCSSLSEIFDNDSYKKIIEMREAALPLILLELQKKPGHWFYALKEIVGYDVAEGIDSFAEAREAWLEWGYQKNYLQ